MNVDDLVTRTFSKTRRGVGYETTQVDAFVAEVADALRERDRQLGELQGDLTALRMRAGGAEQQPPQDSRREASAAAARLLEMAAVEADQYRASVMAEVESRRSAVESQVEALRQQESSHREHLRRHFSEQLAQLDGTMAPPLRAVSTD